MSLLAACQAAPFTEIEFTTDGDGDGGETTVIDLTSDASAGTDDSADAPSTATTDDDDTTTTTTDTTLEPTTTTPTTTCGDGVVDLDEACDDGDLDDTDDCLSTCRPATCGDGFVRADAEACDDGNAVDDDECSNACVAAACGDGVVQPGEACDDGNDIAADECTDTCALPACGDGILHNGEYCDDGGESHLCDDDCSPVDCGDGVANHIAGEDCDDGVVSAQCDADCSLAQCGDGTLNPAAGEACDDGNLSDADNCSSTCEKLKRVVFATSELYTGDLGGLGGADTKCRTLADAAGLPGTFYAWLSVGATSPESRFVRSSVPYVLTDGTQIAKDWKDLTDGILLHPVDTTEKGTPASVPGDGCGGGTKPTVWTNTRETSGVWHPDGCSAWTGTTGIGRLGHAKATNFSWTRFCEGMANSCSWHAAIYCVEQ
jgi:cysteine-rich repeat protein